VITKGLRRESTVRDRQHALFSPFYELDGYRGLVAVFDGVVEQVRRSTSDQVLVSANECFVRELTRKSSIGVRLLDLVQLRAHDMGPIHHVHPAIVQTSLCACEPEERLDECGQTIQRREGSACTLVSQAPAKLVDLPTRDRQWSFELVGCLGAEALFSRERLVESKHELVEALRQEVELDEPGANADTAAFAGRDGGDSGRELRERR
jgi:hypothetical protein